MEFFASIQLPGNQAGDQPVAVADHVAGSQSDGNVLSRCREDAYRRLLVRRNRDGKRLPQVAAVRFIACGDANAPAVFQDGDRLLDDGAGVGLVVDLYGKTLALGCGGYQSCEHRNPRLVAKVLGYRIDDQCGGKARPYGEAVVQDQFRLAHLRQFGFWFFLIAGGSGEAQCITLPTAIIASPHMVAAKAGAPGGCESQASLKKHPTSLAHRIPQARQLFRNSRASGWRRKNDSPSPQRMLSVLE